MRKLVKARGDREREGEKDEEKMEGCYEKGRKKQGKTHGES